jgi:hypothetical protein
MSQTARRQKAIMSEISSFLGDLREWLEEERQKQELLQRAEERLWRNPVFGNAEEDRIRRLREEIQTLRKEMETVLNHFLRVPPWHSRHREALRSFFGDANFESSVFIMTKFPDGDTPEDRQLQLVIDEVCSALKEHGLVPRIASGARFHDWLWDEVEVHLLGCARGIAIVEDRYRRELNPNVAMEWGWMRAMGKRVLFLKEAAFAHDRADLGGMRSWSFDWDDPGLGIRKAIGEWFS